MGKEYAIGSMESELTKALKEGKSFVRIDNDPTVKNKISAWSKNTGCSYHTVPLTKKTRLLIFPKNLAAMLAGEGKASKLVGDIRKVTLTAGQRAAKEKEKKHEKRKYNKTYGRKRRANAKSKN